mmetsp:Transcript_38303/g.63552  ORF Transcript_38303/g.63552 Transcript_38303/m.63552 type:complete len:328 (-) Transcript_38303:1119-2102(-)
MSRTLLTSNGSRLRSCPMASCQNTSPRSSVNSIDFDLQEQIPTSFATCRAVRGASPVSMAIEWSESFRAWMTVSESARVLQAKAMKPTNRRLLSTKDRDCTSAPGLHSLDANASTRMPCSAMAWYVASNQWGSDPGSRRLRTASGDPLTKHFMPSATVREGSLTSQTTDMRWSWDEKWCRCRMRTARGTCAALSCAAFNESVMCPSCLTASCFAGPSAMTPICSFRTWIARSLASQFPGREVFSLGSYRHSIPLRAANSMGSPTRPALGTLTRAWQAPSTVATSHEASFTGSIGWGSCGLVGDPGVSWCPLVSMREWSWLTTPTGIS